MRQFLPLIFVLWTVHLAFGQTTFFTDNFEGIHHWTAFGSNTPNYWVQGSCTQNGGSKSLYITSGGTTNDCTSSGIEHYGYTNNASGSNTALVYFPINASCYSAMTLHADIQIEGEIGSDYLEIVYSTNNGGSWTTLGPVIVANASYITTNQALPALLNNTSYWIGFRFTYNNSNIGNKAPAIDNLSIEGTSSDVVAPTITCPGTQSAYSDDFCNFLIPNYTGLATASDACGILNLTQSPVVGTSVSTNTTITLTATDGSGNATNCQFLLQVIDTISPKPTCIASDSVYATTTCSALIPNIIPTVTIEEYCTPFSSLIITQNPAPGTSITSPVNVFVTVTDLAGNSMTCFTHIFIFDTINPIISCPSSDTVSTNNGCSYDVQSLAAVATVTDNCSTVFSYTQSPSVGSNLSPGTTAVTITATDDQGNSASCNFNLVVIDLEAPQAFCPPLVQIPVGTNCQATLGNIVPLMAATDNCNPSSSLTYSQALPVTHTFTGIISVQVNVSDPNGNTGSCLMTVQAIDTTSPAVTCLNDTIVPISGGCSLTVPNLAGTYTGIDNCASGNLLQYSQSPAPGTVVSSPIQIALSVQDTSGNVGVCYTQLIPDDNSAPTITCPGNTIQNNGTLCFYILPNYTGLATVTDNCSSYTISQTPLPNSGVGTGNNTITLTATDIAGNSTSCSFELTVLETINPSITCPNNITSCNPVVNYTVNSSDNCVHYLDQTDNSGFTSGSIFPIGITTQSYAAIDSSGNSSSCSFTVEILNYPDTAAVLDTTIYLCNTFTTPIEALPIQSGTGSWNVISGNGTIANPNSNVTSVSNLSLGTNKLVWTVTSPSCGSKTDTLCVIVNQPPTTAQVQDTIYACSNSGFLVQGNIPSSGTGTWSNNSGIVLNNYNAPIATILSITPGFHTLYWTINSLGCTPSIDSAIVFAPATAQVYTNDTSMCIEDMPLAISGTPATALQHSFWITSSGNATIANKFLAQTSITSASPGNLVLIYRLTQPFCGNSDDTLTIQLTACDGTNFDIPNMFTPNSDGKNDVFMIPNLAVTNPDCRVTIINRFGNVLFESIGYQTPWDGRYKGEPVPMGTYFYEIISPSGAFEPIKGSVNLIY